MSQPFRIALLAPFTRRQCFGGRERTRRDHRPQRPREAATPLEFTPKAGSHGASLLWELADALIDGPPVTGAADWLLPLEPPASDRTSTKPTSSQAHVTWTSQ